MGVVVARAGCWEAGARLVILAAFLTGYLPKKRRQAAALQKMVKGA